MSQLFSGKDIGRFRFFPRLFFMFFVFDSIDDSATMHNHSPQKFSTEPFSLLCAVNLLLRCAVEFGGVGKNV